MGIRAIGLVTVIDMHLVLFDDPELDSYGRDTAVFRDPIVFRSIKEWVDQNTNSLEYIALTSLTFRDLEDARLCYLAFA